MSVSPELERARVELLELSTRNRLLSVPRKSKSAKIIDIADELTSEVLRILMQEGKEMTFLPIPDRATTDGAGSEGDDEAPAMDALAQPEDEELDERGTARRHSDRRLQTRLTSPVLQKRLLGMFYDARTIIEEQGVNILYLALGMLRWFEDEKSEVERFAPLLLLPVKLERKSASERFALSWIQEDLADNLSLAAKLKADFGLVLPSLPESDQLDTQAYFDAVASVVAGRKGWEVHPNDIVLGFFSFAKYLMYRDLDSKNWPETARIDKNELVAGLLRDGFEHEELDIDEDGFIDPHVPPARLLHVVDADSSQTLAIEAARSGRNLVVQGPPGTGKSQTIANLIGAAVADGKTVLFVAEKMAALDVVKRRLDNAGLGRIALELHSNKANKRMVLDALRRTKEAAASGRPDLDALLAKLQEASDSLNAHAARLHHRFLPSGLTVYEIYGRMERLRHDGQKATDIELPEAKNWDAGARERRERVLSQLGQRMVEIGPPSSHPWRGAGLTSVLPQDVDRLVGKVERAREILDAVVGRAADLSDLLREPVPVDLADAAELALAGELVSACPASDRGALAADCWVADPGLVNQLVVSCEKYAAQRSALLAKVSSRTDALQAAALALAAAWRTLRDGLGIDAPATLIGSRKLAVVTDALAAIPVGCDRVVLSSPPWTTDAERLGRLVEAGARYAEASSSLTGLVVESAWGRDSRQARRDIEELGGGIVRWLSSRYRRALRTFKGLLTPDGLAKIAKTQTDRLAFLDRLIAGQEAVAVIQQGEELGHAAFGASWKGRSSDWDLLVRTWHWQRSYGNVEDVRSAAARVGDVSALADAARTVATEADPLVVRLSGLAEDLGLSLGDVLGIDQPGEMLWPRVAARMADPNGLIKQFMERQPETAEVAAKNELGRAAFGLAWAGVESDSVALRATVEWHTRAATDWGPRIGQLVAACADPARAGALAIGLRSDLLELARRRDALFSDLNLDSVVAFGTRDTDALAITELRDRLDLWVEEREELSRWINYRSLVETAVAAGLSVFVERLTDGRLAATAVVPAFEMTCLEEVLRDIFAREPDLARFDGTLHERVVGDFRLLDRQRMAAAKLEVLARHTQNVPRGNAGIGPMGVLNGEFAKKRRHLAIRQLMDQAGFAIQALKPVMMMSPLSVAQFLKPGSLSFDILVIDEASQVQPVDALGAVARCKQIVVVGDEKQMPPSRFFSRMTNEATDDEDEALGAGDVESILGLCQAKGLPSRMLRWHYRSKHESLIAVSNRLCYDGKLFIVPSPWIEGAGMGIVFHHLPDAVYDRGGTATNPTEARAVAEAVIRHALETPHLSLGVATFSVKQRQCILDELERLRRVHPETELFFAEAVVEPFFVKNLENVQGDERDVIFISVCYGRDKNGFMSMGFGPLSNEGGERRFNVLISRARRRCEVFSPITDEDIDLERGRSRGTAGLKLYLHFARTGKLDLAESTDRGFDSLFEEQVARALRAVGLDVHSQIGQSGFFIDLAIVDPELPGRYVLGIECDGAAYHSARSSRDRDRLRQAVLEDHGWIMHRIWSTDWFQRPEQELRKVVAAYEAAKRELAGQPAGAARQRKEATLPLPLHVDEVVQDTPESTAAATPVDDDTSLAVPYAEAAFPVATGTPLHEVAPTRMAPIVAKIIDVEGPIHEQEIIARVRQLAGVGRAGHRIQDAVQKGLRHAVSNGGITRDGPFYDVTDRPVRIRDRSAADSPTLRKPELLPSTEIQAAVRALVERYRGAEPSQLQIGVARLFGFLSTSQQLRIMIDRQVLRLLAAGQLVERDGYLMVPGKE